MTLRLSGMESGTALYRSDRYFKVRSVVLRLIIIQLIIVLSGTISSGQVRISLFANQQPGSALFTVTAGRYELTPYPGNKMRLDTGEIIVLALFDNAIAVRTRNSEGFRCDSLTLKGISGSRFVLRPAGNATSRLYSGDLECLPDLGKLVLINTCDIEEYVAGVVMAEGGSGRNIEYLKSQALLVRSYLYKYSGRHRLDRYNLCDNTHCQVFNGVVTDKLVLMAALSTKGLVVLDRDSVLINSAFHSNCGGETSVSEDVWISGGNYLKKVIDPYCGAMTNAHWTKTLPLAQWKAYLIKSGYTPEGDDPEVYNFSQPTRLSEYRAGAFSLPFTKIRNDLNLRSSFFSVVVHHDSVALNGRGYGHGVGLCQEGAMIMASKGFKYNQIINFYFSDVIITDVKNIKNGINTFQ
ncbi:MAG: SpoIID/LytB domain-containing protein [Bacteroidales bacterium]